MFNRSDKLFFELSRTPNSLESFPKAFLNLNILILVLILIIEIIINKKNNNFYLKQNKKVIAFSDNLCSDNFYKS